MSGPAIPGEDMGDRKETVRACRLAGVGGGHVPPEAESGEVDKIFHDSASVRRLIGCLGDPTRLRACYEAGPTGYGLHRQLSSLGVRCAVVDPG
jgi:hypothetical protein